jgi:hypothetical protein
MIPNTGERLTKERFEQLHASPRLQPIIMFNNTQAVVDQVIANPLTMIASDGFPGHPRTRAPSAASSHNTCANAAPSP